jgi:putative oxygen-independent coproporphyrinogen III oxidase
VSAPRGVYVHWPWCARICPYCDFNVYRARGADGADMTAAIVADLEGHAARLDPGPPLASIFLGGGTPSLMTPEQVGAIVAACDRLFGLAGDCEISLEANPTDAEAARFAGFRAAGVNRLSLGVQALDDGALALLGRNHGANEAKRAVAASLSAGFRTSLDLIYARPGQTIEAWADELTRAVALGPEHISPYQLTIETGTAFHRAVQRGRLVPEPPAQAAGLYEATDAVLSGLGFATYEISNHAKCATARSAHNLLYWRSADWIGVGPGAHGRVSIAGTRHAAKAADRPGDYVAAVAAAGVGWGEPAEALSPRAVAEEYWLSALRPIDGALASDRRRLRIADPPADLLAETEGAGLLSIDDGAIRLTPSGRLVADRIAMEFASAVS